MVINVKKLTLGHEQRFWGSSLLSSGAAEKLATTSVAAPAGIPNPDARSLTHDIRQILSGKGSWRYWDGRGRCE
jgi:hypothetical protein